MKLTWGLSVFIRILIAAVALGLAAVRLIRPEWGVDWTILALLAVAANVVFGRGIRVKAVDLLGLKLEFEKQELSDTPTEVIPTLPRSLSERAHLQAMPVADSYANRIVKLTPTETIAPYIMVLSMIKSSLVPHTTVIYLSACALFLNITAWYYGRLTSSLSQTFSMTLAFVGWAYALGQPFSAFGLYNPIWGGLVLALVAFALPAAYPPLGVTHKSTISGRPSVAPVSAGY